MWPAWGSNQRPLDLQSECTTEPGVLRSWYFKIMVFYFNCTANLLHRFTLLSSLSGYFSAAISSTHIPVTGECSYPRPDDLSEAQGERAWCTHDGHRGTTLPCLCLLGKQARLYQIYIK